MGITYGFPQASFFRPQDRADADFVELWLKGACSDYARKPFLCLDDIEMPGMIRCNHLGDD
jgi:hypothetical protein